MIKTTVTTTTRSKKIIIDPHVQKELKTRELNTLLLFSFCLGTSLVYYTPDFEFSEVPEGFDVQPINVSPRKYYFKYGETLKRDYDIKGQYDCVSPDGKDFKCTAFRKSFDITADYVMTWVNKNRGCKCTSSGETEFRISHYDVVHKSV